VKKILLSLSLLVVILTGCSSEEYKQLIDEGNKALADKEYDKAILAYSNALREEQNEEALALIQDAYNQKYEFSMEEGDKAYGDKKFKEAIAFYEAALEAKKDDEDAERNLKEAKSRSKAQSSLDSYSLWLSETLKEGIGISNKWDNASFAASNGMMSKNDLKTLANELYEPLVTLEADVAEKGLDTEVPAELHEELVAIFSNKKDVIKKVVSEISTNKESTVSSIVETGSPLSNIRADLTNYERSLVEYAEKNGLKYERKKKEK